MAAGATAVPGAGEAALPGATGTRLLLLGPALGIVVLVGILPLGIILVYSFLTPGTFGGVVWKFSAEAYAQFLFDRDFLDDSLTFNAAYLGIFGRSLVQAGVATAACLLVGFPTAYFMATRPPATRNAWVFLITVPFWTNLLIRTVCMLLILRDEGLINNALVGAGLISTPIVMLYTDFAIGLGLMYSYLPFMVLPLYASLEKLDFRLVEAAYDLYAGRWRALTRIIIPLARPGIVAGCLLVFIPSLGAFLAPDLLGGGKHLMIGNLIQLQFASSRNWPFGSAAAMILLAAVLLALMLYVRTAAPRQRARP